MISRSPPLTTTVRLLGAIALSMILYGCDSDAPAADPSAIVTITASATQGTAPFAVRFDVDARNTRLFSGTWDFGDGTQGRTFEAESITHTFTELGQYTTTVTFDADRLSVETTEYTVEINVVLDTDTDGNGGGVDDEDPDVNLIISSFAIDDELTPGGLETVSAIVQNIGPGSLGGASTSGFITVGYYLSEDSVITVDDLFIGDTNILVGTDFSLSEVLFGTQSLSTGENYQFEHQLAVKGNVPAGTYFAGAIVDFIDEYDWYDFPRSTDSTEYTSPVHIRVPETNEEDNARLLPAHQVTVAAPACIDDAFEDDDSSDSATIISLGQSQVHNFCFDNADWLQFDAVEGSVYKITTSGLGLEADTQLVLYDRDAESILLFHDNFDNGVGNPTDGTSTFPTPCGSLYTVDLECGWPPDPSSDIVWEAHQSGRYFIRARLTTCDEDKDLHCASSPDGVGLDTEYTISLQ